MFQYAVSKSSHDLSAIPTPSFQPRVQVHHHATWHMLASTRLGKEPVLEIVVQLHIESLLISGPKSSFGDWSSHSKGFLINIMLVTWWYEFFPSRSLGKSIFPQKKTSKTSPRPELRLRGGMRNGVDLVAFQYPGIGSW